MWYDLVLNEGWSETGGIRKDWIKSFAEDHGRYDFWVCEINSRTTRRPPSEPCPRYPLENYCHQLLLEGVYQHSESVPINDNSNKSTSSLTSISELFWNYPEGLAYVDVSSALFFCSSVSLAFRHTSTSLSSLAFFLLKVSNCSTNVCSQR